MHTFRLLSGRDYNISTDSISNGEITLHKISLRFEKPTIPQTIVFKISYNGGNLYSTFAPNNSSIRALLPEWLPKKCDARLASSMPLTSLISLEGINGITVSLSDAKIPSTISSGMSEDTAALTVKVSLFTNPISPITEYEVTVRVDERKIRYEEAISSAVEYWENECGYTPATVPAAAFAPLNSAWYSYHQKIDVDRIVNECKISKSIGMDTIIIDDGWQTDDNGRGYAYCGDWKVAESKIPSMKDFVDRVHSTEMKFMLWYSVPYIGRFSENFERFRDKFLDYSEEKNWFCIDPRYPDAREFLVSTYKNALIDFGLDGFKLDFIDAFKLAESSMKADSRRDTESLEDAIQLLLSEISAELRKINPDVLIEFRQSYVGPVVRMYGNMLRVTDCPTDPIKNRVGAIDLRLTSGKTAVHSDMLMWGKNESSEVAATALISTLFSVPQISMKLDELSKEHMSMLSFFLSIARKYQGPLLHGSLRAENPESFYSKVTGEQNGTSVTVLYTSQFDKIPSNFKEHVCVNGTSGTEILLESEKAARVKICNCLGEVVEEKSILGLSKIIVPRSGVVFVQPE